MAEDFSYEDLGITALEMIPAKITGTSEDVVDAGKISRDHATIKNFKDNDRTEDSLRHILLGGLLAGDASEAGGVEKILRGIASFGADFREGARNPFKATYSEDKIDLNNNAFGKLLRQMYPDREEFISVAKNVADNMYLGNDLPEIQGITPLKSFGSLSEQEAQRIQKKQFGGLVSDRQGIMQYVPYMTGATNGY